jgi:hypothetical protein
MKSLLVVAARNIADHTSVFPVATIGAESFTSCLLSLCWAEQSPKNLDRAHLQTVLALELDLSPQISNSLAIWSIS